MVVSRPPLLAPALARLLAGSVILGMTLAWSTPAAAQISGTYFTGAAPITELNAPGSSNFSPSLTEDELYMVFASNRAGTAGGYDLYETRRPTVDSLWATPVNLTQLNSVNDDYEPDISYDGLRLLFVSTRAGGVGPSDIYLSQRPNSAAPWGPPVDIGAPINGAGIFNDDPHTTQDGLTLFYTSGTAAGTHVWMATRPTIAAPFNPGAPFAPANSTAFDHSPLPEGNGDTLWFSSTRAPAPVGSTDFYMITRDPVTGLYSAPVAVPDMSSTDWDSNAWRNGVTQRMYVSQFVGANSFLWILCPRLVVVWVPKCILSAMIPVSIQWFPPPPRIIWRRIWLVSILVPQVQIQWYRWFRWPLGGISVLQGSLSVIEPPIPASVFLPGAVGAVYLGGAPVTLQLGVFGPNQAPGLQTFNLGIPNNPALVGLQVHLQNASLEFGTNLLEVSEAGTIRLTP